MHGGKREGAGRPVGSKNRSTPHQNERITELAKTHCELALQVLVDVALNGTTDSARVSAANALLDRAFGRPYCASAHRSDEFYAASYRADSETLITT